MLTKPQRICDECGKPIAWGERYIHLSYQLLEDHEPQIGTTSVGSSVPASNTADVHVACCHPEFFVLKDLEQRAANPDRSKRNRW